MQNDVWIFFLSWCFLQQQFARFPKEKKTCSFDAKWSTKKQFANLFVFRSVMHNWSLDCFCLAVVLLWIVIHIRSLSLNTARQKALECLVVEPVVSAEAACVQLCTVWISKKASLFLERRIISPLGCGRHVIPSLTLPTRAENKTDSLINL